MTNKESFIYGKSRLDLYELEQIKTITYKKTETLTLRRHDNNAEYKKEAMVFTSSVGEIRYLAPRERDLNELMEFYAILKIGVKQGKTIFEIERNPNTNTIMCVPK